VGSVILAERRGRGDHGKMPQLSAPSILRPSLEPKFKQPLGGVVFAPDSHKKEAREKGDQPRREELQEGRARSAQTSIERNKGRGTGTEREKKGFVPP